MSCQKHPKYQVINRPIADCAKCWELWREKYGKGNKRVKKKG